MKKITFLLAILLLAFTGCSKNDDDSTKMELKTKTVSIYSGEKATLQITPNSTDCIFKSDNPLIASVSNTGEITGITVGETYITISKPNEKFSAKCKAVVKPKYTMYREPYMGFGSPVSSIKAFETRRLLSEKSTGLLYDAENSNITGVMYLLENGVLESSACLVPTSKISLLADFISERYVFVSVGTGDILAIYVSNDMKIAVGIAYYSISTQMVFYYESPNAPKSKSGNDSIINEMIKLKESFISMQK